MATQSQVIAKTILEQLGGLNTLVAMLGAYNFVSYPEDKKTHTSGGVSFKIKCRGAKANYVKILLNHNDLYNVEFGKIHAGNYKILDTTLDVYNDMLIDLCEGATGLTFRMPRVVGFNYTEPTQPAPGFKVDPTPAGPMAAGPAEVVTVPSKGSKTPTTPAPRLPKSKYAEAPAKNQRPVQNFTGLYNPALKSW